MKKTALDAIEKAFKNDIFHRKYKTVIRTLKKEYGMVAHEHSIGFFRVGDHEYQLFFKACLFNKDLLKRDPCSGGLVKYATKGGKCDRR